MSVILHSVPDGMVEVRRDEFKRAMHRYGKFIEPVQNDAHGYAYWRVAGSGALWGWSYMPRSERDRHTERYAMYPSLQGVAAAPRGGGL